MVAPGAEPDIPMASSSEYARLKGDVRGNRSAFLLNLGKAAPARVAPKKALPSREDCDNRLDGRPRHLISSSPSESV